MRAEEERKKRPTKRPTSKFLLTPAEHEVAMSYLPRNYSLVEGNEWITYLVKQEANTSKAKTENLSKDHQRNEVKEEQLPAIESQFTNIEANFSQPTVYQQHSQVIKSQPSQQRITPGRQKISEEHDTPIGHQSKLILHLLSKIVNHPQFTVIFHAEIRPTAQQRIDAIKYRQTGNYSLIEFQYDIQQLFASFFEQVGPNQRTSLFRDLVKNNIRKYVKRNKSQRQQKQKNVIKEQAIQVKNERTNEKEERESESALQRKRSSSREQSDENIKTRLRGDTIIPRTPESYVNLNDMAALGFNIRKLSSEHLKWICLNFISGSKEKAAMKSSNFTLDLETLSIDQFGKLESFVKKKLSFAGIPYERPPSEEDDSFVIEDDGEDFDGDH